MGNNIDLSSLDIAPRVVEQLIAPFMLDRMPRSDPRWRAIEARLTRRWTKRILKRRLLGWLPGIRRDQDYVRASYNTTFAERPWVETHNPSQPETKPTYAAWQNDGLVLRRRALARTHLLSIGNAIAAFAAKTVLEVGAGAGMNLFVLASRFPDTQFTGIELTETGVGQAKRAQGEHNFPQLLADYCPWTEIDSSAYRRIDFRQGDATKLPFADGSVDLVITRQALEQMESVREAALREIARVARLGAVMCEPFADFNRDKLRRRYVAAKDYFSLPSEGLRRFGLAPLHIFSGYPQNLQLGVGVVVAAKAATP